MSDTIAIQNAWTAYQAAVDYFMAPPEPTTRGGDIAPVAGSLNQRGQIVLARSQEFGDALTGVLQADNPDQRELVGWKLLAAAAQDVSLVADLLTAEGASRAAVPTRSVTRSAIASTPVLKEVLAAPLDIKMTSLAQPATRGALPTNPTAAREKLKKTIAIFVDEIPHATASMGQTAVSGVMTAGLIPAQWAASVAAQEVLANLPQAASVVARQAAQLLTEAMRKIQAALGQELQQQLQDEVFSWFKDIQEKPDSAAGLLGRLYRTKDISQATLAMVTGTPATLTAECYNQATQELTQLMTRYSKTKQILEGFMRVLALAHAPLLGAVPWGPIGVYGSYVSVFAYAIFSGGDYLDWDRLGTYAWLDRVCGLRTTVRVALQANEADGRNDQISLQARENDNDETRRG